jgi:parvulin-like peptidyl-prolyl isomerase
MKALRGPLLLLAALGPGVVPAAEPGGHAGIVARVGGKAITAERFRGEMARRGGGLPGEYATPEQRRALLDEMVEIEALAAVARRDGLDRDPALLEAFDRLLVSRYLERSLQPSLDQVVVSDDEVRVYYERHKHAYAVPERVRAAVIQVLVPSNAGEERWAEAEAKAMQALEEARSLDSSTRHFGPVAVRYSDDRASRYQGGVIGWLTRGATHESKWAPEVVAAAWSLERPGDFAPIVRASDGVYVVRLADREESKARSFEALEAGFRSQILREKQEQVRRDFVARALAQVGAEVDDAVVDSIPPPPTAVTAERPPALPAD